MAYRETEKMRQRKAEARKRIMECTYRMRCRRRFPQRPR